MGTLAGVKNDSNKSNLDVILGDFARALLEVGKVGQFGLDKYCPHGWLTVPNNIERYSSAMLRHYLDEMSGKMDDDESELIHAAHVAWNALARLELILRELERLKNMTAEDVNEIRP